MGTYCFISWLASWHHSMTSLHILVSSPTVTKLCVFVKYMWHCHSQNCITEQCTNIRFCLLLQKLFQRLYIAWKGIWWITIDKNTKMSGSGVSMRATIVLITMFKVGTRQSGQLTKSLDVFKALFKVTEGKLLRK